jgi:hypothetical protein
MAAKDLTKKAILEAIRASADRGVNDVSSADIVLHVQASTATVRRYLEPVRRSLTLRCLSPENAHLPEVNSAFSTLRALIQRTPNRLYI